MAHEDKSNSYIYKNKVINKTAGGFYGLGFFGALFYFLQHATTFWIGVLAFLKAFVWPAFIVYGLLNFFKL